MSGFRKAPVNLQSRVARRLVLDWQWTMARAADGMGVSRWRIGQLIKRWCVVFHRPHGVTRVTLGAAR